MWEFTDNSDDVMAQIIDNVTAGLYACGEEMEGNVKERCPVDTGRLRGSITHTVNNWDYSVTVGTNVKYAVKQEIGDYQHKTGQAHFMRDGIQSSKDQCEAILSAALRIH